MAAMDTCCVCRQPRFQVQIHHLDENASNNTLDNLVVLCGECHSRVHTKGSLGRALSTARVRKYRDEWHEVVATRHSEDPLQGDERHDLRLYVELVRAAAEAGRWDTWEEWTRYPLGVQPLWHPAWSEAAWGFARRIAKAIWPGTVPDLERALATYATALTKITQCAEANCWPPEHDEFQFHRGREFYKDQELRSRHTADSLVDEYERWRSDLQEWVRVCTRSANWVASVVRAEIDPAFRLLEGHLAIDDPEVYETELTAWQFIDVAGLPDLLANREPFQPRPHLCARRRAEHE